MTTSNIFEDDLQRYTEYLSDKDYPTYSQLMKRLSIGAPNLNGMGGKSGGGTTALTTLLVLSRGWGEFFKLGSDIFLSTARDSSYTANFNAHPDLGHLCAAISDLSRLSANDRDARIQSAIKALKGE